jgi:hypothetical protein
MSRSPWNLGGGPTDDQAASSFLAGVTAGTVVERGAQGREVEVAVDAAELLGRLAHPGGHPTQHHLPVASALDVDGVTTAATSSSTKPGQPRQVEEPPDFACCHRALPPRNCGRSSFNLFITIIPLALLCGVDAYRS